MAPTNLGHHAFGTAKILDGIIRQQSAFLVHLAAEAKLGARVVGTVITTASKATVTASRRDQVVTTERRLDIVDTSSALLVDLVCMAEEVSRIIALNSTALALVYTVLWIHVATTAEEVCRVVHSAAALANDGAFVTEVDRRVVSLFLTAPRMLATRALVEVVLATDVR